jgi:ribosomal protein S6--L-glutamate ligase
LKIIILARKPNAYFNQKLEQAAKHSHIEIQVLDPLACELLLDGKNTQVIYNGKPVLNTDFVIPRMGAAVLEYGISVLRHFEILGIPVLNSSLSITNILNRFEYLQILASHEMLSTPKSVLIRKSSQIKSAMERVNGPPAVLKVMSSNNKLGAMLIDKVSTAESFLDVNSIMGGMGQLGQDIIIEEYIKEAEGKAIHLLVVNKEVAGAFYTLKAFTPKQASMFQQKPAKGLITPELTISQMATYTTRVLNLDFALISFLDSIDGPRIYKINITPEIDIFEKVPGAEVPAKIIAYAADRCQAKISTGVKQ